MALIRDHSVNDAGDDGTVSTRNFQVLGVLGKAEWTQFECRKKMHNDTVFRASSEITFFERAFCWRQVWLIGLWST